MNVQIGKWGNSFALRIPLPVVQNLELHEGSLLSLTLVEGALVLKPVPVTPEIPSLEELLERITDENRHEPTKWGPPVGLEVW